MPLTPNSPRTEPPRRERKSNLSWLFFLLVLARPLWGILRSTIGAGLSDTELWLVVGAVLGLAALVLLAPRARASWAQDKRLSTAPGPSRPNMPALAMRLPAGQPALRPPRYEPIITANVVAAGLALLGVIGGVLFLLWLA